MERLIDVYYRDGHFLPWTEGLALLGSIAALENADLPPRVKRMRRRPLRAQLLDYYEKKFGRYVE